MDGLLVALVIVAGLLSSAASVMAMILMIDNRNQRRALREYVVGRTHGLHVRITRLERRNDGQKRAERAHDARRAHG